MKKLKFILLDAGPIIKLFELGLWDTLISKCEITISRIVMEEAKWASKDFEDVQIDLEPYVQTKRIQVIDSSPAEVASFFNKFNTQYKSIIDDGEKETLAFLHKSTEPWKFCSADHAAFRVLGLLGNAEQCISLEELLGEVGLLQKLEWQYIKRLLEQNTRLGQKN